MNRPGTKQGATYEFTVKLDVADRICVTGDN